MKSTRHHHASLGLILVLSLFVFTLPACSGAADRPVDPDLGAPAGSLSPSAFQEMNANPDFLAATDYDPAAAEHFALIAGSLGFSEAELAQLRQHGFVVSDRLAWTEFSRAYAYIYWQDLPVLVTTDSILHAVHETYDDLLTVTELDILGPQLTQLLERTRSEMLQMAAANDDPDLAPLYVDLEVYLTVPLILLTDREYDTPDADGYVALAQAADQIVEIPLFGAARPIDFTLFQPRGHYTERRDLGRYFRAMMWLAQVDFRLLAYEPNNQPVVNREAIAAAMLLRTAIDEANKRPAWQNINSVLTTLVGRSDNTTLPELDQFLADAGLDSPGAALQADTVALQDLLTTNDYGRQYIVGQVLATTPDAAEPIATPVSFMLFGQRFTVDSYIMSNLVFDRLLVDGAPVKRAFPSPLEVMYALGNDRAAAHLESELTTYGHQASLVALREEMDDIPDSYWQTSAYNQWLNMLRTLDSSTTTAAFPPAMRTAAWQDKMLATQLASWTQLRHDNILYVVESLSVILTCEYPAGYVEPYPAFYGAVHTYAQDGLNAFANLDTSTFTNAGRETRTKAMAYFQDLGDVAIQLQTLSEKELQGESFSDNEILFLKSIVRRDTDLFDTGCAGMATIEYWDGWYMSLLPWADDTPALVADVHTNPNTDAAGPLPPGVLHVGTGPVAAILFIVDTDSGPALFVGPAFTYFEFVEEGYPPKRLTDDVWRDRLEGSPYPTAPAWTSSFRLSLDAPPEFLRLPES